MSNDTEFSEKREALKRIPQVSQVLDELSHRFEGDDPVPHRLIADSVRDVIERFRRRIIVADTPEELEGLSPDAIDFVKESRIEVMSRLRPNLKRTINATGVILHTNLGRSPLSPEAVRRLAETAGGYVNLELDLETGERFSRLAHIEGLLCRITGAESAAVVNNNAGATLLVLAALARNREVIISRGQLIEIGDSYRLPDIMVESGARLVEVGTTNRTYLEDYRRAIGPDTAMIMRVHQSNYRVVGYSHQVEIADLAHLAHEHFLPLVDDLGSGALVELPLDELTTEPLARASITEGADLVTFSGDKLMGGPQAGIIVGRREFIESVRKSPLARALRVGKLTLVAMEATLRSYLDPAMALSGIPALRTIMEPASEVRGRALEVKAALDEDPPAGLSFEISEDRSRVGGGSLPTAEIPSFTLIIEHQDMRADDLSLRLRRSTPPVVGRVKEDRVVLDIRTVPDEDIPPLIGVLRSLGE